MPGGKLSLPESERLVLREWREKDWPFFAAMNANPQVMRFFPGVMTEKDSLSMWNRIRKELDERGYGLYAVELKHSGSLIGLLGFHWADFEADFTPCVEIGWRLPLQRCFAGTVVHFQLGVRIRYGRRPCMPETWFCTIRL